jgi:hypothetical protein
MKTNEEENEQESEVLDFTQPTFTFKPNEAHEWRQQGPYLVCKSCELSHATYIGMDKILVGLDEKGKPILKKR